MGAAVMRWFSTRSETTTSHPLKSARCSDFRRRAAFVPTSGNSRTSSVGRGLRVDQRRERVVVHHHELGGVGGEVPVLGHHGHDGLAREPHDVGGQQRPSHAVGQHGERVGDEGEAEVGAGEHAQHARLLGGLLGVDVHDPRVRVGRADVRHPRRAVERDVLDVGGGAGQEAGVLDPLDAVAEDAHVAITSRSRGGHGHEGDGTASTAACAAAFSASRSAHQSPP